jgi:Zn-dependent M28 family amino/carboxypeptidase
VIVLWFTSLYSEQLESNTVFLKNHVETIVTTSKPRNYKNIDILDSAALYIKTEFEKYGYKNIREQKYDVKGDTYQNVIASVGPEDAERVVIGAHYDVFGNLPGADDNASAVAGLLECARIIYKEKDKIKNRIDFVAYSLEEPPYFNTRFMGSYIHSSSLSDSGIDVKLMICLEMIGYYSDEKNSQDYPLGILKPFYGSRGNYIACVSNFRSGKYAKKLKKVFNKQTEIKSKTLIAPSFLTGIDFSDHRNYWGYKMHAIMVTDGAFYRNKNYHTSDDTIDRLNFDKMGQVVNGMVLFVLQL